MLISGAASGVDGKAYPNLALIAIYGGFLRLASHLFSQDPRRRRQSRNWFSGKIVLKQRDEIRIRFHLTSS